MRFGAELLKHKPPGFPWNVPAFDDEVGISRSHDKKLAKTSDLKAAFGRLL